MNYQRIYETLCKRGQVRTVLEYTEKHHIVPRCLGGGDSKSNLTNLTAKEHYLAHYLLTKIHPTNYKLFHAFSSMARVSPTTKREYTAKQYEKMSKARSIAMKENNPAKGGAWNSGTRGNGISLRKTAISDAEKKMLSERLKKNNPNSEGLVGRKEVKVTCVETSEVFIFSGLSESERQISELTGKVINHTSVWNNMKKNRPYKGYLWEFNS